MSPKAGSMREKRPGVFEFRLYVGRDPSTGKHRWKSHTWKGTRRNAGKALAVWVVREQDNHVQSTDSLNAVIERWLRFQESRKLAPNTLHGYRGYWRTWIKDGIGTKPLDKLTPGDLEALYAEMTAKGKAPATVRQAHNVLRGALRYAKSHRLVQESVASDARVPKLPPSSVVAATREEVEALYEEAGPPGDNLPTAIALGAFTGARLGELCSLRWSSVDFEAWVLHLDRTKTHSRTVLPVHPALLDLVRQRMVFQVRRADHVGVELAEDPYLLSYWSDGSRPPRVARYSDHFGRVRDRLDMPHLHFHSLRHSAATWMLQAGVDAVTVSKMLGHRNTRMIGVYGHETPASMRRAADAVGTMLAPKELPK